MMAPVGHNKKRKHSETRNKNPTPRTTPRKRQKKRANVGTQDTQTQGEDCQVSTEPDHFYSAIEILEESKTQYRIEWAPSLKGERYDPTWEPKRNANKELVEDWERKKAERKQREKEAKAAAKASPVHTTKKPRRKSDTPKRRKNIVIEGSSSPEPHAPARQKAVNSFASEGSNREPSNPPEHTTTTTIGSEPEVLIKQPNGFHPSQYERFSQSEVAPSDNDASSQVPGSSADHSASYYVSAERLLKRPHFDNGAVVPDSQDLDGDSSYVPSTQTRSIDASQANGVHQTDSASTSACNHSSASALAQFIQPQAEDLSGTALESDPIEDPSSPAALIREEEAADFLQPETPRLTASSASSPPPTETPEKSQSQSQSQSQPDFTQASSGEQTGQVLAVEDEQTSDPEDQSQEITVAKRADDTFPEEPELEKDPADVTTQDESEVRAPNIQLRNYIKTYPKCNGTREPEEDSGTVEEQQEISQTNGNNGQVSVVSQNNPHISIQDETQQLHFNQRLSIDSVLNPIRTPPRRLLWPVSRDRLFAGEQWPAAQVIPEFDLDDPQESTESVEEPKAKLGVPATQVNSSQECVEPDVLDHQACNTVDHPVEQRSCATTPEVDIVPSIEGRTLVMNQEKTSSSIPALPSQLPETFGTNPPPPIQTPSSGMPATPQAPHTGPTSSATAPEVSTSELSLTERHRLRRETIRAEATARKAALARGSAVQQSPSLEGGTRSPSVIPPHAPQLPMEPQHTLMPSKLAVVEQPVEQEQIEKDLPDAPAIQPQSETNTSSEDVDTEMQDDGGPSILLDDPYVGEAEFVIGLSMEGLQGDQYRRVLKSKKDLLEEFSSGNDVQEDAPLLNDVQDLLREMQNVTTHLDLGFSDADALTQYNNAADEMAAWSRNSSAKFRFLGCVLERLRSQKLHIVVLARPGRLIEIIETFMAGMDIQYSRGGNFNRQVFEARDSLFVTILGTGYEVMELSLPPAQLIIALDQSLKTETPKTPLLGASEAVPLVTPIVTNSLEHIERCISSSIQGVARLRLLVRFMAELRQQAGRVDQSLKADQAADLLVNSIQSDLDHHEAWPIPRIGSIKDLVQYDDSVISSLSAPSSAPMGTVNPSGSQKRHLEVNEQGPAKKVRLTPQSESGTVNPNDITRISDSVRGASQSHPQVTQSSDGRPSRSSRKTEALRKELDYHQNRVKEMEEALAACQFEKEEQRDEILRLRREVTDTKTAAVTGTLRLQTQANTITNLKAERLGLQEQLAEARTALETSALPEIAEREALRRERDEAVAAFARAQKGRESDAKDMDFFRSQYQDASNSAAELSTQNSSLTQRLREAERLASGERERVHQLSLTAAGNAYREENERLSARLRDMEELIRRKDEELKAIRGRQGVGTRAGSVPRSPRIIGGGPGSRGGSPAPSGLGRVERLRNLNA